MGKIKFVSNEGNFTAKGYVLNEVYETGPRTESGKNPGKFYYSVKGKNVAGINEWETNLFLYFKFPSGSEEANQANAYLAILKGTPVAPVVQTAPIQQSPTIAPQQPSGTPVQPTAPITQVAPATHVSVAPTQVQDGRAVNSSKEVVRDILLAGLTNLDFQSLNLKLLKIEGKITLSVIMDGMPPLAINSGDISAASIVEQIVSTFSENALIVSTIREWNKSLKELQTDTEEKIKKAKEANVKADQPIVEAPKDAKKTRSVAKATTPVETAIPNEPIAEEPVEPDEEQVSEPDAFADVPPEDGGNGLDQDVEDYVLK